MIIFTLFPYNLGIFLVSFIEWFSGYRKLDHSSPAPRRILALVALIFNLLAICMIVYRFIGFYLHNQDEWDWMIKGYELYIFAAVFAMGLTTGLVNEQRRVYSISIEDREKLKVAFYEASYFVEYLLVFIMNFVIWAICDLIEVDDVLINYRERVFQFFGSAYVILAIVELFLLTCCKL